MASPHKPSGPTISRCRSTKPLDALAIATARGYEPRRTGSPDEYVGKCPQGCDDAHKQSEYRCYFNTSKAVWYCHRCGEGGFLGERPQRRTTSPTIKKADSGNPIDVASAWKRLESVRFRFLGQLRRWARDRGWEEQLVEAFVKLPGIVFAPPSPLGETEHLEAFPVLRNAERLRRIGYAHGLDVRPVFFAIHDESGQVCSLMHRCLEPTQEAKSKSARSSLCPSPPVRVLGQIPSWVEAARSGGVVLLVEGEPDWAAAAALARLPDAPIKAAIGSPACVGLPKVAAAAARALQDAGVKGAKIVCVPDLGDAGYEKMLQAAHLLADHGHQVSLKKLPLGDAKKIDLAGYMEREGLQALCAQLAKVPPPIEPDPEEVKKARRKSDEYVQLEIGSSVYKYGPKVSVTQLRDGEDKYTLLGWDIWPLSLLEDLESGQHSLLIRYRKRSGRMATAVIGSEAFATTRAAGAASEVLSKAGVRIDSGKGRDLVLALGTWAQNASEVPTRVGVAKCGWHKDHNGRDVFVAGDGQIIGVDDWVWSGPRQYGQPQGDLDAWKKGIKKLVGGSKVLQAALGISLAGPLVGLMNKGSFGLHIHGTSSCGKTLATRLAATVWQTPRRIRSWKDTGNFIGGLLPLYSGKNIVLDDIKKARMSDVRNFILAVSDNATKGRSDQKGKPREVHYFELTLLSSGEQSTTAFLGTEAQGGHTVRVVNLSIQPGEATTDAQHAANIESWLMDAPYGVAGLEMVRFLQQKSNDKVWRDNLTKRAQILCEDEKLQEAIGTSTENQRIAFNLAMACVALEVAESAGVIHKINTKALLLWLVERVCEERGSTICQEERCLQELFERLLREPACYPTSRQYVDNRPHKVFGIYDPVKDQLCVTEGHIKPLCRDMSVTPRSWLRWLVGKGYATPPRGVERLDSCKELKGRWYRIATPSLDP